MNSVKGDGNCFNNNYNNNELNSGYNLVVENNYYIYKKVIFKGFEDLPKDNQEVTVNYISKLSNGEQIDNTYIGRQPHVFVLGNKEVIPGLEIAIKSMQMKEVANFIIYPEFTYKALDLLKKGELKVSEPCFIEKPANVDFKAKKYYEKLFVKIELIKFDDLRVSKDKMSFEDRIKEGRKLKLEGNKFFKESKFNQAIAKYETGLDYLSMLPSENLTCEVKELKAQLNLNIANSHISLNEFNYALKKLNENFLDLSNLKANYFKCVRIFKI